jgi:hypothetical protein
MADYLERLGLRASAVISRIRFLTDRASVHTSEAHEVEDTQSWRRIASFGAAGTCLCQAASLSLLLGHDADDFLYQAAQNYLLAEHPYGIFLMSFRTRADEAAGLLFNTPMRDWLIKLERSTADDKDSREERKDEEPVPPQLLSTNQQLYLCFAMVSIPVVAQEYRNLLRRMIKTMQSHSNLPHGPQGQPLQTQLDILEPALNMIVGERHSGDINQSMRAIARLSDHYGESIEAARRNSYLWRNMWSPVEYLDLEIVAAAMCMGRASRDVQFQELASRDIHAGIPLLIADERLRPFRRQT